MSVQEMEAMDREVMGMVNDHAAPESVTRAEQISEDPAVKSINRPLTSSALRFGKEALEKEALDKMAEDAEIEERRKTMTIVAICVMVAISLLAVMAKPDLLVWLVNIGVACCSVVAGIALDRRNGRR